jgi:hypothetical protein
MKLIGLWIRICRFHNSMRILKENGISSWIVTMKISAASVLRVLVTYRLNANIPFIVVVWGCGFSKNAFVRTVNDQSPNSSDVASNAGNLLYRLDCLQCRQKKFVKPARYNSILKVCKCLTRWLMLDAVSFYPIYSVMIVCLSLKKTTKSKISYGQKKQVCSQTHCSKEGSCCWVETWTWPTISNNSRWSAISIADRQIAWQSQSEGRSMLCVEHKMVKQLEGLHWLWVSHQRYFNRW